LCDGSAASAAATPQERRPSALSETLRLGGRTAVVDILRATGHDALANELLRRAEEQAQPPEQQPRRTVSSW